MFISYYPRLPLMFIRQLVQIVIMKIGLKLKWFKALNNRTPTYCLLLHLKMLFPWWTPGVLFTSGLMVSGTIEDDDHRAFYGHVVWSVNTGLCVIHIHTKANFVSYYSWTRLTCSLNALTLLTLVVSQFLLIEDLIDRSYEPVVTMSCLVCKWCLCFVSNREWKTCVFSIVAAHVRSGLSVTFYLWLSMPFALPKNLC